MTIVNEQYVISNLTPEQYKLYYNVATNPPAEPQQQQQVNAENVNGNQAHVQNVVVAAPTDPAEQQALMIKEFSNQSKLNFEWSKHCLEHAKWNFDDAAKAFMQFKNEIPKEAFLL